MAEVYGNVNVNYSYCKFVAQLKSAVDYILGTKKEQLKERVRKTRQELYEVFGCNRDNFANSLLIIRKMHDKKYLRYKQKDILAHKMSISFHPDDNDKLTYGEADRIARGMKRCGRRIICTNLLAYSENLCDNEYKGGGKKWIQK